MRRRLYSRKIGTCCLLAGLTLGFCYLFCLRYGVFGAKVDWISQHSVLPDYFRQQFYETGELFPEFAANIGGGQNIYHFAYYGLYNPLLLPSYLLPSVKMADYMMAVQLLTLAASVILMYCWLGKRGFPEKICVGAAVVFLLSGPMIFHSYNQIMFVNYMPFLLAGMMGVDRYFEKKRGGMLVVSIFLMIMTSFYFSIGGMLALVLYGIHRWMMIYPRVHGNACPPGRGTSSIMISLRCFLSDGIRFSLHFVIAVMMSGILLLPTAFALTGREGTGAAAHVEELLIPKLSMLRFCYSPYGIGMTTLGVTAVTAMIFRNKWHERVLALSCGIVLTIPVFAYLLNGGLYIRDKVMIPFLPLLCYILAYYLDGLETPEEGIDAGRNLQSRLRKIGMKIFPYVLTVVLIYLTRQQGDIRKYWKLLLADSVFMLVCFIIYTLLDEVHPARRGMDYTMILLIPSILFLAVSGHAVHARADRPLDREFYEEMTDSNIGKRIEEVTGQEEGFYRTEQIGKDTENAANLNRIWDMGQYSTSVYSSSYHEGYREFREKTFRLEEPFRNFLMQPAVHNPVYQRFMGVKYVAAKEGIPGYEAVKCSGQGKTELGDDTGKWKVYENTQVSPVAYGTDRVISEESYRELDFPYNQLALLEYAVVKDGAAVRPAGNNKDSLDNRISDMASPVDFSLPDEIDSDIDKTVRMELPVSQEGEEGQRVLFLRFQIENQKPSKDVAVWVEGIRNKLTARSHFYYNGNTEFTYAVPVEDGQDTLEMVFGKGNYGITGVKAYIGRLPVREEDLYQSAFQINRERTKGNRIEGTIEFETPGYFITTIPYEESFEVLVDGEQVGTEEVNTAFLGFRIGAGKHEIRMIYHAPGAKAGKILSMLGVVMFFLNGILTPHRIKRGETI